MRYPSGVAIRIVHEGRGGHVEVDGVRHPLEHVGDGRFVIHVPRTSPLRRAIEAFVAEDPGRFAIEPP